MLRADLFDSSGNWIQGDSTSTAMDVTNSANGPNQFTGLPTPSPGDLTLSAHLSLPAEFLNRFIRNKVELAALQRVGGIATELDDLTAQIRALQASPQTSSSVRQLFTTFSHTCSNVISLKKVP